MDNDPGGVIDSIKEVVRTETGVRDSYTIVQGR